MPKTAPPSWRLIRDDMSIPFLGHLALSGRLEAPSSLVAGNRFFRTSAPQPCVGCSGVLVEMIAKFFRPLLCPLPRHAYLPLFYAFFVVGSVPEFPELRAGLGVQHGLHRFFDGLPAPLRPSLRLAHQDLACHLLDASIFAHGALLFLAVTLPQREYNPARFLGGATDRGYATFLGRGRDNRGVKEGSD